MVDGIGCSRRPLSGVCHMASLSTVIVLSALGCSRDADARNDNATRSSTPLRTVDRSAIENLNSDDVRQVVQCAESYGDVIARHGGHVEISLSFASTDLSDGDLATVEFPNSVRSIDLSRTQITDAGLVHLKRAHNLVRVILNETQITDAGLDQLKQIETIATVDLTNCPNVSREARLDLIRFLAPRSKSHQHERRMHALNKSAS